MVGPLARVEAVGMLALALVVSVRPVVMVPTLLLQDLVEDLVGLLEVLLAHPAHLFLLAADSDEMLARPTLLHFGDAAPDHTRALVHVARLGDLVLLRTLVQHCLTSL